MEKMRYITSLILCKLGFIDFVVKFVETTPLPDNIPVSTVVITGNTIMSKWAHMQCPCGCGEILSMSLMKSFIPKWKVEVDRFNRVTLHPSIWKSDGCKSHFFLKKGKITWV